MLGGHITRVSTKDPPYASAVPHLRSNDLTPHVTPVRIYRYHTGARDVTVLGRKRPPGCSINEIRGTIMSPGRSEHDVLVGAAYQAPGLARGLPLRRLFLCFVLLGNILRTFPAWSNLCAIYL